MGGGEIGAVADVTDGRDCGEGKDREDEKGGTDVRGRKQEGETSG